MLVWLKRRREAKRAEFLRELKAERDRYIANWRTPRGATVIADNSSVAAVNVGEVVLSGPKPSSVKSFGGTAVEVLPPKVPAGVTPVRPTTRAHPKVASPARPSTTEPMYTPASFDPTPAYVASMFAPVSYSNHSSSSDSGSSYSSSCDSGSYSGGDCGGSF